MRVKINLQCSECGSKNYLTSKNAKTHPDKIEVLKYCPKERKVTLHPETKEVTLAEKRNNAVTKQGPRGASSDILKTKCHAEKNQRSQMLFNLHDSVVSQTLDPQLSAELGDWKSMPCGDGH